MISIMVGCTCTTNDVEFCSNWDDDDDDSDDEPRPLSSSMTLPSLLLLGSETLLDVELFLRLILIVVGIELTAAFSETNNGNTTASNSLYAIQHSHT
jgi:uncharacterized protein YqhQ